MAVYKGILLFTFLYEGENEIQHVDIYVICSIVSVLYHFSQDMLLWTPKRASIFLRKYERQALSTETAEVRENLAVEQVEYWKIVNSFAFFQ